VLHAVAKGLAFYELGGNIVFALGFSDFIDSEDVGVIESGSGTSFLDEAIQAVRVFVESIG
jgi:hypothetical protein